MGCTGTKNIRLGDAKKEDVQPPPFKLNWKPGVEKENVSKLYPRHPLGSPLFSLPPSIDLSPNDSPIKDQGQIGACTAFSAVAVFEHNLKSKGLLPPDGDVYSERFVYFMTRRVAGIPTNEDSGGFLADVAVALKQYGACQERLFPYSPINYSDPPSAVAMADALKNQALEVVQIPERGQTRLQVLAAIKLTLSQHIPVFLGFNCFYGINDPEVARTGKIPHPRGDQIGGHAIEVVGYNDATSELKFKNSWSTNWGDHGYGYLPYAYVLQSEAGDIWTILSQEIKDGTAVLDVRRPLTDTVVLPTPPPPPPGQDPPPPSASSGGEFVCPHCHIPIHFSS